MTEFSTPDPNAAGSDPAGTWAQGRPYSAQQYPAQDLPPQGHRTEFDDAIAAGLADRVEQIVAARASQPAAQIEPYRATPPEQAGKESEEKSTSGNQSFMLGIVSLGAGIPITAIAAEQGGLAGLIVAWAGIVGVNVANGLTQRRSRRGNDYR